MKNQKEILKLLKALVSFESDINNPKEKQNIVEYCLQWLRQNKISVKKYNHPHSPSFVASLKGDLEETILFVLHLDIVPASKKMFKLQQTNKKLIGRGVIDDKGPSAITMLLLKQLKLNKTKNIPNIQAVFTTDEEVGGRDGIGKLMKKNIFNKADAVIILDSGKHNTVVCREKGVIHLTLETKGKASHGAYPWEGQNAIDKMLDIYVEIKKIFIPQKLEKNHWHPTINIGFISGGQTINQVPDQARMGLDIRFTEKENLVQLENKIKKIIKNKAKIIDMVSDDVFCSDENHPLIKKYCQIVGQEINCKINISSEHGSTSAKYFKHFKKPVWLHYPKGGKLHSENEWVDLEYLEKMLDGLLKFIAK